MNGSDLSNVTEKETMELTSRAADLTQQGKAREISLRSVLKTIFVPVGTVAGFLIATFPLSLPAIYGLALLLLYYFY